MLLADLSTASGVLTPHVLSPGSTLEAIWDGEVGSLKHGVFNLGFLGVRDTQRGERWQHGGLSACWMACWDAPGRGLFTDQKWMNLAPIFFPGVECFATRAQCRVVEPQLPPRSPGTAMSTSPNGSPLIFFHFTKAETVGPLMTSLHARGAEAVASLWEEYLAALGARRRDLPDTPTWGYGQFLDGTPITDDLRLAFRNDPEHAMGIPDPFGSPDAVRRLAPSAVSRWLTR